MARGGDVWTPDRIGTLCRDYMAGQRFEDIAPRLGTTKSAAIGKFNRLIRDGHALALQAASERTRRHRMNEVAKWMSAHGGSVADCARSLGTSYDCAKSAWNRVRAELGSQAR